MMESAMDVDPFPGIVSVCGQNYKCVSSGDGKIWSSDTDKEPEKGCNLDILFAMAEKNNCKYPSEGSDSLKTKCGLPSSGKHVCLSKPGDDSVLHCTDGKLRNEQPPVVVPAEWECKGSFSRPPGPKKSVTNYGTLKFAEWHNHSKPPPNKPLPAGRSERSGGPGKLVPECI